MKTRTQPAGPVGASPAPGTGPARTARASAPDAARASAGHAAGLAALLTALAVCAGDAVARAFPFGPRRRAVNDLANQFVPYHAHLWDLLHGRADGGLLLNWRSGWGTSFLPDLGTYLTSPFAPLVGLFPRADIEYAVYTITVLKMAVAAAAMTALLLRTRPGARWAAGLLGAAYGLCGWSVTEATYNPMWLDGLIAFPLLCVVGEWVRQGRRPLLGALVVAVCWVANFYTAYMATLGAALVLLVRLAETDSFRVRVLGRAAATTGLGVGLAAPVLVPVLLGSRLAYPGLTREFAPAAWPDFLARLLPATYSFSTPALFVFTAVPVLAGSLPLRRDVPRRERWLWAGLAGAVAMSTQWGPTHLLWHVFATPNGSPYRQTFVLAGVLVLAAWTGLARGLPDRRALLGGAGVTGVLAAAALTSPLAHGWALALGAAGCATTVGAALLPRRGRYTVVAAVLLSGTLVGQAAATTAWADRERLARLDDYPAYGAEHERRAAALAAADGWPAYRTDSGLPRVAGNDPLLLGGQGAAYYSSHTPETLTRTLAALGGGWTSRGRNLLSLDNPVTDALFGVGARWRDSGMVHAETVLPLVTVRPPGAAPPRYGPSPFRNQEQLLGSRVYEPPGAGGCPIGREVFLWAPDFAGTARLGARTVELPGGLPKRRAAMVSLGVQRTADERPVLTGRGARGRVECLDRARLRTAVADLRAAAARAVSVTDTGVRAALPPGARGTVVLAAPRIAGWRCGGRPADSYGGLVATPVPADGTAVVCAFRPPGLRAGLVTGAVAALVLAALLARAPGRAGRPFGRRTAGGLSDAPRRRGRTRHASGPLIARKGVSS
ncbi:YfhO family protein [Streptomyces sp. NPDC053755]|uniref:YfhO family protein n=1 Tax=Streptomyces sp. NPDC053755 TaxID=3155815 RepID=UPI00343A6D11